MDRMKSGIRNAARANLWELTVLPSHSAILPIFSRPKLSMLFSTPEGSRFSCAASFKTRARDSGLDGNPVQTASETRPCFPILQPTHSLLWRVLLPFLEPFPYHVPVPAPASPVSASMSLSFVRFAPCPPIVWSGPPILSPSEREYSTKDASSIRESLFRSEPRV